MAGTVAAAPETRLRVPLSTVTTAGASVGSMTRWQPTWGRLGAGTGALFLVTLAFLAGRVRAGHDPALRTQPASAPVVTQSDPGAGDDDPSVVPAEPAPLTTRPS